MRFVLCPLRREVFEKDDENRVEIVERHDVASRELCQHYVSNSTNGGGVGLN
jgi:hypothetical protein